MHVVPDWYYCICWKNPHDAIAIEVCATLAEHVDTAFKTKLLEHMSNARDFAHFRTLATTVVKEAEKQEEERKKDIAKLERRMEATLLSLTDPELPLSTRKALNTIYAELDQQKQGLENPPEVNSPEQSVTNLLAYHDLIERLGKEGELHFADMKLLAQATTTSITIDMLSPHFLLLTIAWRTPVWGTDTAILWRADGRASTWKEEELTLLKTHYPTMAQGELLRLLPQRSWTSIEKKAERLGIVRIKRSQPTFTNTYIT